MTRPTTRELPQWLQIAAVATAALASAATTALPPPPCQITHHRAYAAWGTDQPAEQIQGCANLQTWVSRSGKRGLGVTVRTQNLTARPCAVEILAATFDHPDAIINAALDRKPVTLAPDQEVFTYLAFPFDNEAAWNAGVNSARLLLHVAVDGVEHPIWRAPLIQRREGDHRVVDSCHPQTRTHLGAP